MSKKLIVLTALVLLLPLLGCGPVSGRVSSADAGTPIVQVATSQPTASPTDALTLAEPTATPVPATATSVPPTAVPPVPTAVPADYGQAVTWKSFTSPNYHYSLTYPSDWSVSVETPGPAGDALQIERVTFKQPNYGSPDQFATVMIEAAQHAYTMTGQCQGQTQVVPGIQGCRRSMPRGQNPAQEVAWFHPSAAGQDEPYFFAQLAYEDPKYIATFAHMLDTFKYSGLAVTVPPAGTAACTYRAGFVADVTIPDNTVVAPGAAFTKTWRVRNDGTCTWGYAGSALHRLVFVGGILLGAPAVLELPFPQLGQGGTVDISVPMVAPTAPGTYTSNWRLQVDNGPQVGVGPNGDTPFYAQIVVAGPVTPSPVPPPAWKTYTSTKHSYSINYPASWDIKVETPSYSGDPENVFMRPGPTGFPAVELLVLNGSAPITGFENCDKNLIFRGYAACSISLPGGQYPSTQLLVFQKGDTHFHLALQNAEPEQLAIFEEIVKSFRFTP